MGQSGLPELSLVGQKRSHPEEGEGAAYHEVALCLPQWLSCDVCNPIFEVVNS